MQRIVALVPQAVGVLVGVHNPNTVAQWALAIAIVVGVFVAVAAPVAAILAVRRRRTEER